MTLMAVHRRIDSLFLIESGRGDLNKRSPDGSFDHAAEVAGHSAVATSVRPLRTVFRPAFFAA
jgi:hypothetical protein